MPLRGGQNLVCLSVFLPWIHLGFYILTFAPPDFSIVACRSVHLSCLKHSPVSKNGVARGTVGYIKIMCELGCSLGKLKG